MSGEEAAVQLLTQLDKDKSEPTKVEPDIPPPEFDGADDEDEVDGVLPPFPEDTGDMPHDPNEWIQDLSGLTDIPGTSGLSLPPGNYSYNTSSFSISIGYVP